MGLFTRRDRNSQYNDGYGANENYGRRDDTGFNNNTGHNDHHNRQGDSTFTNNNGPFGGHHDSTNHGMTTNHGTMNNHGMTNNHTNHNDYDRQNGSTMGNTTSPINGHHGRNDQMNGHNKRSSGLLHKRGNHNNDAAYTNGHDTGHHEKGRHHRKEKRNREMFDVDAGRFNKRPSFGQWLKFMWLDILTMAALGAVGLGVYEAHPAPSRSFPVTFSDGEIVYPQFAYPVRHEIIPIWAAALLGSLVPIFVILCMQIRIRSFWDVNNAVVGLLYSLITAAVFQVFIKWLIGGLRPHFLSVCDPDPALLIAGGKGLSNLMFQRNICRGNVDDIDDSLESMPSGHTTAAFAGFVFLSLYLNAKLKVWSNYHPAMWKLVATYAPILGACLIGGSLSIDEYHNWYDILAGAVIGTIMAFSAYRMVYASVWDFRFNHIPLTRHTPFSYGAGKAGAGGFESAIFTRQAGWGYEEAYGGAPFDAAYGLRGGAQGFNADVHHRDNDVESGHKNGLFHRNGNHNKTDSLNGNHHGTNGIGHNNVSNDRNNLGHNSTGHHGIGHNNVSDDRNNLGHASTGHHGIGHNTVGNERNDLGREASGNFIDHNARGTQGHNVGHNTGAGYGNDVNTNTGAHHGTTLGHNTNHGGVLGHNNDTTTGYNTNDNQNSGNMVMHEPTTPTSGGRYHQHSKSLERKAIQT